jgi:small-conductance mechanosensitive channel
MDVSTFYALTAATCFTLVGLWWSVVKDKQHWFTNEASKRLAGGVFASFLIPGVMSLAAQIGLDSSVIWRAVFIFASFAGFIYSSRLINLTRKANPKGPFSRNSWVVPLLYVLILFFAVFASLARYVGLQALQLEALLLCGLILCAHGLAWEFLIASQDT